MRITELEVKSLNSETITKKDYDTIIKKIDKRFAEIMAFIMPDRSLGWFDYGNCSYYGEKSDGWFDPKEYADIIMIGGEAFEIPEPYEYDFPTRWLWTDFKTEYKKAVSGHKKSIYAAKLKAKKAALERKVKETKLWKSIKAKLTPEELKIVRFK